MLTEMSMEKGETPKEDELPFPSSLCHRCAAPPKYVRTNEATYILCPLLTTKYPPQPVVRCHLFRERLDEDE